MAGGSKFVDSEEQQAAESSESARVRERVGFEYLLDWAQNKRDARAYIGPLYAIPVGGTFQSAEAHERTIGFDEQEWKNVLILA
eukprot:6219837-Pyramimonas_sp.AAC.1